MEAIVRIERLAHLDRARFQQFLRSELGQQYIQGTSDPTLVLRILQDTTNTAFEVPEYYTQLNRVSRFF